MPVLINSDSGNAENLPDQQTAAQALLKGTHNVPLVNQSGEVESFGHNDVSGALSGGYTEPSSEQLQGLLKTAKFGSPGQQAIGALEGFAQGVAGPVAPAIERGLGVNPENINYREEANPTTHALSEVAGFALPLLLTAGASAEARAAVKAGTIGADAAKGTSAVAKIAKYGTVPGLITSAGELANTGSKALGMGIIGGAAASAATEMALMSGGDEISNMVRDRPADSLGSALTNVGLSGLLGAVGGGALGAVSPLWKATVGDRAGQMIEDMRGRYKFRMENPDLVNAAGEELQNYYTNISNMNSSTWGPKGVKAQVIEKLMPEMNDKIRMATTNLADGLNSKVLQMTENPDIYPTRLSKQFEGHANRIIEAVTDPNATPAKIFDAVQTTKQWAQEATADMWKYKKFDPEYEFAQKVSGLSKDLRPFLENPDIWGEAGKAQQSINKGFSKFLPSLEDFQKKFTSEVGGVKSVDMGKVNTLKNQLGKANGEIRQTMLKNFLDDASAYQKTISEAHEKIGSENPFQHTSLSAVQGFLGKQTPGAQIIDKILDKGMANIVGKAIGGSIGAGLGSAVGHPGIGFLAGEHAIGPLMTSILPSLVEPIMKNQKSSSALKAAADYGLAVVKGEKLLNGAAKNLFKGAAEVLPTHTLPTEKKKEKLEKAIKNAQMDPSSLINSGGDIGHYLPSHGSNIGMTVATAVNYLTNMKPKPPNAGGMLDTKFEVSKADKATYDRVLDIAEQPLIVVQHIKDGTLLPQDVISLKTMYPGAYQKISQSLMTGMVEHLSKGDSIPYKQRMGLSLFLGQPLDATMSPQSIIATQTSGQSMPPQKQMPQKPPTQSSAKAMTNLAKGNASGGQMREMQKAGMAKA